MQKQTKIIIGATLALIFLLGIGYLKKSEKFIFKKPAETNQLKKNSAVEADSQSTGENVPAQSSSEEEKTMEDWLKKCEAGESISLAEAGDKKMEEIQGKISIDYLEDQAMGEYFIVDQADQKQKFSVSNQAELDLLDGRQVVLQGEKIGEVFSAISIRCVTSTEAKNILEYRREVMTEAEKRIGEISGENGKFGVESFWWQNNDYFYVDFFDQADEDIYFEALVFVEKVGEKVVFERAALFKNSGEDGDWELISGKDLFEDQVNEQAEEDYYEYDELLKAWSPAY